MARIIHERSRTPIVLDGAWATQLQARGLELRSCADVWNLEHPERVEAVARSYVEAGSQIILTNTFGANRVALSFYGMTARVAEINRAGVRLSRAAASGRARVFASMGPSRKSLARGLVDESTLTEAFTEQANVLADAGAEGLALETFTDLDELLIAVRSAQTTELPVVACMAVLDDSAGNSPQSNKLEIATEMLEQAGVDGIGANCGTRMEAMVHCCRRLRAATDLPLWFKPNAGMPTITDGRATYSMNPECFAAGVRQLIDAGADMIGGCCGTDPNTIRDIVNTIRTQDD